MFCRSSGDMYLDCWIDGKEFNSTVDDMLFDKAKEVTALTARSIKSMELNTVLAYVGIRNISLAFGGEYKYRKTNSIYRLSDTCKTIVHTAYRGTKVVVRIDICQSVNGINYIKIWTRDTGETSVCSYYDKLKGLITLELSSDCNFCYESKTDFLNLTEGDKIQLADLLKDCVSDCDKEPFPIHSIAVIFTKDITGQQKMYKGYGIAAYWNYDDLLYEEEYEYRLTYFLESLDIM